MIHCDSATQDGRKQKPTLRHHPCSNYRTAASDAEVQEALSVLGIPVAMPTSGIMSVCRTMFLTYLATEMPVPNGKCEWWQWIN